MFGAETLLVEQTVPVPNIFRVGPVSAAGGAHLIHEKDRDRLPLLATGCACQGHATPRKIPVSGGVAVPERLLVSGHADVATDYEHTFAQARGQS
jgi:hypothetical protein